MRQNVSRIFAAFLISALLAALTSCAPQRHPRTMEPNPYSDPEEMLLALEIIETAPEDIKEDMVITGGPLDIYRTVTHVYELNHLAYRTPGSIVAEGPRLSFSFTITEADIKIQNHREYAKPLVFDIQITNLGKSPANILWDKAAFYDQRGRKNPVLGSGHDFSDFYMHLPESPRPSAAIASGETTGDILLPRYFVNHKKVSFGGWRSDKILEWLINEQTVGVLIPVVQDGELTEYRFTFEATSWRKRF